MSLIMQREFDRLKKQILNLSAHVEEALQKSIKAVNERDATLAKEVISGDHVIDSKEVEVEEECLKILALHQPVAVDLRYVISVLKINNDLERMGDLAAGIAKKAVRLAKADPFEPAIDYNPIFEKTITMVTRSLDSLIKLDSELAREVCKDDDIVDAMKRDYRTEIESRIKNDPENANLYVTAMGISRSLERIADLATNIAEDVVYMAEGDIIRHNVTED